MPKNRWMWGILFFLALVVSGSVFSSGMVRADSQMSQEDSQQAGEVSNIPVISTEQTSSLKRLSPFPSLILKDVAVRADHPLYLLVEWGDLGLQKAQEWHGFVVFDQRQMTVLKKVGLEDDDRITTDGSDSLAPTKNITIVATTHSDRDGLLLKIVPPDSKNAGDAVVTFNFNERTMKFTLKELFESNGPVSDGKTLVDNAETVSIISLHRFENVPKNLRDRYFSLKLKALEHFLSLEKYLKQMQDEGKIAADTIKGQTELQQFATLLDGAYRLGYTDDMLTEVDKTFEQWKKELKTGILLPDKLLSGLDILVEKISVLGLKEKFRDGVTPFCDVDDSLWFADYVDFLKIKKIVSGDAQSCMFRPNASISRAEFLKMALIASGNDQAKIDEEATTEISSAINLVDDLTDFPPNLSADEKGKKAFPLFEDARHHWAKNFIVFAKMRDYINGSNQSFYPDRAITRAEAITMLIKTLNEDGGTFTDYDSDSASFQDIEGHWALRFILTAKNLHLIENSNGNFRPDAALTRAEAAKIISMAVATRDHRDLEAY